MHKFFINYILILSFCLACSSNTNSSNRARLSTNHDLLSPKTTRELIRGKTPAPKPEELKTELKSELNKWWYGDGVGKTTANIATIVVFPPWGLYLLANAGIALAGYEPIYLTDALPKKTKAGVLEIYDRATSVPGRINAAIAGREFYSSTSANISKSNEKNRNNSKINAYSSKRTSKKYY